MENKAIVLTASANVGIGLWTSICVAFTNIFGIESKNFSKKMQRVMDKVKKDLEEQMSKYPEIEFSDFRIVKDGSLAYTGTVIGYGPVSAVKESPKPVMIQEAEQKPINQKTYKDKELAKFVEEALAKDLPDGIVEDPECRRYNEEARYYYNIKEDFKKAFELFKKASVGSPRAKYNLGYLCYYSGLGTLRDEKKGIELIKESAAEGYKKAIELLEKLKIK